MDKTIDLNKWLTGAGKSARWGIRILYVFAFAIYGYFMYFDSLFDGSRVPLILALLAVFLVVPLVIFPTEWVQRLRIWRFAGKQELPADSIPDGNKLAVTGDGDLLTFRADDKWKVTGADALFAFGAVRKEVAPKEALSIHKETQEHLAWSNVVIGQSEILNLWLVAGNVMLFTFPQVRDLPGITTDIHIISLIGVTSFLLLLNVTIRDWLTRHFFLGSKKFVVTTENEEGKNPQYALFDTNKTDAVLAMVRADGLTVQLEAVTLNGGLLYAVLKEDIIIKHMIIEKE